MKTYNFKSWTHKYIPLIKASSLYKAYLIALRWMALRWADDAVYAGESK